jgi:hypothetical protein
MVTMLAPKTETINTGNKLWTSSDDMSINMALSPSAQMPGGSARRSGRAATPASSKVSF